MRIAVIPARGGSKRIPRKNIRPFCGKPMIAWAISAAKSSALFSHVVVSTDDDEVGEQARQWGAATPFVRPEHLADDHTPTVPVVAHAIEVCRAQGWSFDAVCCIYPCSPFLQTSDLIEAMDLLERSNAAFVYPVSEYAHPIQRAMRRLANGQMQLLSPQYEMVRTQDLEPTYHDAGQFYWGQAAAWLAHGRMHTDGLGMPIPSWRVVDIDTEDDWVRAERIFHSVLPDPPEGLAI